MVRATYPYAIRFRRFKRFLERALMVLNATFDLFFLDAAHAELYCHFRWLPWTHSAVNDPAVHVVST